MNNAKFYMNSLQKQSPSQVKTALSPFINEKIAAFSLRPDYATRSTTSGGGVGRFGASRYAERRYSSAASSFDSSL